MSVRSLLRLAAFSAAVFGAAAVGAAPAADPAVEAFRKAAERNPTDDVAHYNLGVALFQKREFAAAGASFERALTLNPANAEARQNLASARVNEATTLLAAGNAAAAAAKCELALAAASIPEAHFNLAVAKLQLGRTEEALLSLAKAGELAPEDPDAPRLAAQVLLQANRTDLAIASAREAVRRRPAESESQATLGSALQRSGETMRAGGAPETAERILAEAEGAWAKASAAKPTVEYLFQLGAVRYLRERYPEAIEAYRKALAIQPAHALSRYNLGCLYSYRGQHDEALEQFQAIPESDPIYSEAVKNIALALARSIEQHLEDGGRRLIENDHRGAMAQLRRVLALDAGNLRAGEMLRTAEAGWKRETSRLDDEGDRAWAAGKRAEAFRAWQEALDRDPEDARAKAGIERVRMVAREVEKAHAQAARERIADGDFVGAEAALVRLRTAAPTSSDVAALGDEIGRRRRAAVEKELADAKSASVRGDLRGAQGAAERAVRTDPRDERAGAELVRHAKRLRDEVELRMREGVQAKASGELETAKRKFGEVLQHDPANRGAQEALKELTGRAGDAAENAQKIRDFYYRGIDFYTNGELDRAIEMWRKVLEIDPTHYEARLNVQKAQRKITMLKGFRK